MAQSVEMKLSIVPMLICIMPLPFAMPPSVHSVSPISNCTANSLMYVSVVRIARAASADPVLEMLPASSGIAFSNGSIGSGTPITPVAAGSTSSALMPRHSAAICVAFSAISSPSGVHVLAFPLLQSTACAVPLARCLFVTAICAAFTLFFVYTAAAFPGTSLTIRARSGFSEFFFIPLYIPPALNPVAAVTPPSMIFTIGTSCMIP